MNWLSISCLVICMSRWCSGTSVKMAIRCFLRDSSYLLWENWPQSSSCQVLWKVLNDPWPLKSPLALTPFHLRVPGELDTYETLSSDMQKNVLSALQRLKVVTKMRLWVAWWASANVFGFLLISWSVWEAVWCSSICFLITGQSRMNTEWARKVSEEFRTHSVSSHQADAVLFKCPCLFHQSVRFDFLLLSL